MCEKIALFKFLLFLPKVVEAKQIIETHKELVIILLDNKTWESNIFLVRQQYISCEISEVILICMHEFTLIFFSRKLERTIN